MEVVPTHTKAPSAEEKSHCSTWQLPPSAGQAGQLCHVRQMDVAAHHHIGPAPGPGLLRGGPAMQAVALITCAHHGNRLVHHHHAQLGRRCRGQQTGDPVNLGGGNFAILVPVGPRGVDTDH